MKKLFTLIPVLLVACSSTPKQVIEVPTAHTVNTSLGGIVYPLSKAQGVVDRLYENSTTVNNNGATARSRIAQALVDDSGQTKDLLAQTSIKADEAQAKVEADAETMKSLAESNVKLAVDNGNLRTTIGQKDEVIGQKNWQLAWLGIALVATWLAIAGYIAWRIFWK